MSKGAKSRDDEMKYCLRLNLTIPEHLEIHKTLRNLNPELYRSINQFMIAALSSFIHKADQTELLTDEALREKLGKELVTKSELENVAGKIKEEVTREILTYVLSSVMKNNTPVVIPEQTNSMSREVPKEPEPMEDETLAELAGMWSD